MAEKTTERRQLHSDDLIDGRRLRQPQHPPVSTEKTRAVQEMMISKEFSENLFDPDEVTLADLTAVVNESRILDVDDIDEVAVNVVGYSNYVFVTP